VMVPNMFEAAPKATSPGIHIRVVVQFRDDHFITRSHFTTQGPGELIGEGGHVLTEDHLLGLSSQEVGHCLSGLIPDPVRFGARWKGPVGVGISVKQVICYGDGDRARDLSAAGSVEVRHLVASVEAL